MIVLATCQAGLESIVADELRSALGTSRVALPGLLRFPEPARLPHLVSAHTARTADDLYVSLWHGAGSEALHAWLARPALDLPGTVLAAHRALLAAAGRRPSGRFKVTCFITAEAGMRRHALEARLGRMVLATYPTWRLDDEHPDAEIVLWAGPEQAIAAWRLTEPAFRHRGYTRYRAALSPTVAAALVRLSAPNPEDRFLDPCCGGGTILLERAVAGPFAALLGGDIDPAAVATARINFGRRHRPWRLQTWDARQLPLAAGSVDALVTNLPFGVQVPAEGGVSRFTAQVLTETARVLAPAGRAVILDASAETALPTGLRLIRTLPVALVGRHVRVRVLERTRPVGAG